jgi:soluble lytic murein transglycosylase
MHEKRTRRLIGVFITLVLGGCLSTPPSPDDAAATPSSTAAPLNNKEFEQASIFDRYIKSQLSIDEIQQLKDGCRVAPDDNPFCFSVKRLKQLDVVIEEKSRVARPGVSQPITPFLPDIRGGKIRNWTATRKAKVQQLLAGMSTATLDTLRLLATVALRERRCPNNAAISTAALMESYLIDQPLATTIAKLYEKGGVCARRHSYDREHFLTRAALFWLLEKNYGQANRLLAHVEPRDAFSGRAVYWLARVRHLLGDEKGAQAALRRLRTQHPFSFHALVSFAAENVDPLDAFQKREDGAPVATSLAALGQARSARNPRVNALALQIEILHKYGFDSSAAVLVDWALEDFGSVEPEVRIHLAALGEPRTQVLALQDLLLHKPSLRNQQMLQLAFPKAYYDILEKQKSVIDPYLLLAVARKESVLNPQAVSPANAQGLLQLNPVTARKLRPGDNLNLLDPATNIEIAAKYLANLLQMMRGQLPLVIASYNAGEDPVLRWVKRYPTSDQLLFIDLIPYRETRDYVGFVLSNYYWYRRLYDFDALSSLRQIVQTQLAKTDLPDSSRAVKSLDVDKLLESSDFAPQPGALDSAQPPPDTSMSSPFPPDIPDDKAAGETP